jgi:hypothetical protein
VSGISFVKQKLLTLENAFEITGRGVWSCLPLLLRLAHPDAPQFKIRKPGGGVTTA